MANSEIVSQTEDVARILNPDWIEDGVLMHEAFALNVGESYVSVNRPLVESYADDVADFIRKHPDYSFGENTYKRAVLNVSDICSIDVSLEGVSAKINVEVEPRDSHTKSHAGIFTRINNQNIKRGQTLKVEPLSDGLSADTILLEVRMNLLDISKVETCSNVKHS